MIEASPNHRPYNNALHLTKRGGVLASRAVVEARFAGERECSAGDPWSRVFIAIVLLLSVPLPVHAEVMDKEPTLRGLWGLSGAFWLIGIYAWRRSAVWGRVVALLAFIFVASTYTEVNDPIVRPAILAEAGSGYFVNVYICLAVCALLQGGLVLHATRTLWSRPTARRAA